MAKTWTASSLVITAGTMMEKAMALELSPDTHQLQPWYRQPLYFLIPNVQAQELHIHVFLIYFAFIPCRPSVTRIFTVLLWFVWRRILLSLLFKSNCALSLSSPALSWWAQCCLHTWILSLLAIHSRGYICRNQSRCRKRIWKLMQDGRGYLVIRVIVMS